MKTKNAMKFFAAATIVVAGLTACAGNENPVDPESFASTTPSGDQAEETTYATFTFNFNDDDDSATRALMLSDEYEPDPPVINDIRLLFFRGSDNAPMLDTMFTFGSDPASPVTVPMYSGTKRIFVIANSAGKTHITNLLPEGLSYSNVQSLYDIGSGTPPTALDFSELVKTSSSSRSMVYSSSTKESNIDARPGIGAAESQHPSSDNYYAITLRRLVAKVTVGLESASVQNLADGSGKVQNLKYSIRNVNRSLYLFQ
ncbi:MAG: hypothetical protein LBS05_06010, partial [Tannerellaceae bacterium]|nr:hypothetical protein [Tannerellaceae bacterium]